MRLGLKKTSLEDLTRPAGIAKSSFYTFFESKEALYLELLFLEGPKARRVVEDAYGKPGSAVEKITRLIEAAFDVVERTPLARRLVTYPEEWRQLAERLTPEDLARQRRESRAPMLALIRQAQTDGVLSKKEPEVILGAIRSVTMLIFHEKDIGSHYEAVRSLIVRSLAEKLAAGG